MLTNMKKYKKYLTIAFSLVALTLVFLFTTAGDTVNTEKETEESLKDVVMNETTTNGEIVTDEQEETKGNHALAIPNIGTNGGSFDIEIPVNKEESKEEVNEDTTEDNDAISNLHISQLLPAGQLYEAEDGRVMVANKLGMEITKEQYDCLVRIVYAEAGNQGVKGMVLVANVVLNRVRSWRYPDNIVDVVFQYGQFSPTFEGGLYYYCVPTREAYEAVRQTLEGADYSKGALYFCCKTGPNSMFNTKLKFLFRYGAHYFYTVK